jgi:hypothetical protein
MLLPCIIHRANYLLLAEELRLKLIADGIDDGRGQQIYKLDIDYGNYDARETIIEQKINDLESYNKLSQEELKKALSELQKKEQNLSQKSVSNVFKSSQNGILPIDLERDWLNVTVVDIENYASFVLKNNAQDVIGSNHIIRYDKKLKVLSLMDSEKRKEIKLINLNGKHCSIQQKDMIKVLTTSNSGKNLCQ